MDSNFSELQPPSQDHRLRDIGKSVAGRIIREHPTLVVTLGYLGLTMVGLVYDFWFYMYFRINILDYSEPSDFLLGAIRNPLVIILAMLPIAIMLGILRLRATARARFPRYDRYARKYEGTRWSSLQLRIIAHTLFIAVYAILFTQVYAKRAADRIKTGNVRRVNFAAVDGVTSGERPILLGSNTRFFFLYYPAARESEIVPIENTTRIRVDSRLRRERIADSLAATKNTATPR